VLPSSSTRKTIIAKEKYDSDNSHEKKENLLPIKEDIRDADILQNPEKSGSLIFGIIPKEHISTYLLLLAISIHSLFEGIAVGLLKDTREIFYMLLAVCFHKWVEALSVVNIIITITLII